MMNKETFNKGFLQTRIPFWLALVLCLLCSLATILVCDYKRYDTGQTSLVGEKRDTTNLLTQLDRFPQLTKTATVVDTVYKTIYKTSYREVVDTITEINRVIIPDTVKIIEDWTTKREYSTELNNFLIKSTIKYNRLEDISVKKHDKVFPIVGVGYLLISGNHYPSIYLGVGYKNMNLGSQVLYLSNNNELGLGLNLMYEFR